MDLRALLHDDEPVCVRSPPKPLVLHKRKGHPHRKIKPVHRLVFCKKPNFFSSNDSVYVNEPAEEEEERQKSTIINHTSTSSSSTNRAADQGAHTLSLAHSHVHLILPELCSSKEEGKSNNGDATEEEEVDTVEGFVWFATSSERTAEARRKRQMALAAEHAKALAAATRERAASSPATVHHTHDPYSPFSPVTSGAHGSPQKRKVMGTPGSARCVFVCACERECGERRRAVGSWVSEGNQTAKGLKSR